MMHPEMSYNEGAINLIMSLQICCRTTVRNWEFNFSVHKCCKMF